MPSDQAGPKLDAPTLQRLARLAGLELEPGRAERLLADFQALVEADRRLERFDLGDQPPTGAPWGAAAGDD
jgi:Asp-tRNA(Asn)/Glu-tRNA(Gln) amidotransferase C subunit